MLQANINIMTSRTSGNFYKFYYFDTFKNNLTKDCIKFLKNAPVKLHWLYYNFCVNYFIDDHYLFILTHYSPHLVPDIGLAVRVFANRPGDLGSIPGRVIPKTQKMVLDASLLNTQHYKVRIKGKVEQSRERSSALPYTLV